MKTRIALGAGLLLTIGSAVAGTMMYGQARTESAHTQVVAPLAQQELTLEMISQLKASASSGDYITPRAPI